MLEKSAARQNINHLSRFELQLRFMYHQKTIAANYRPNISGSFPVQSFHCGFSTRPFHERWKEMRERRFFVHGMSKPGFEQVKGTRGMGTEQFDCRHHEQLERNHGRNWIPGPQ